ncbi:hypothetical protein D5272_15040 [bacterium D16-76]|nr:hypothetical protein [bacterium D16-76]
MDNVLKFQNYPLRDAEKIAAELKSFTGGSKEKAVSKFAGRNTDTLLREIPRFCKDALQDQAHPAVKWKSVGMQRAAG